MNTTTRLFILLTCTSGLACGGGTEPPPGADETDATGGTGGNGPLVTDTDWGTSTDGSGDETASADDGTEGDPDDPGVEVACDETGDTVQARPPVDCDALGCRSWCDAATWPAGVPGPNDAAVIPAGTAVVVDCDAEVGALTVEEGGALVASRAVSSTLTLHGNLVVQGRVDYGTSADRIPGDVEAQLVLDAPGDDQYVGTEGAGPDGYTPLSVLDSDVGVWVVDHGVLTAAGATKRAWARLRDGAGPGDPTFVVDAAEGWQPGDTIMLTPTSEISSNDHFTQFDEGTIASVDGDEVTLSAAPTYGHDGCDDGCWRRGEAANLTRNVVIRSQSDDAHAHIMVGHQGVLQLDSAELRWLGPLQECTSATRPRRRSAIYFHQQLWDADDSFVHHTAIWGGNRGFVQQEMSHGVGVCDVVGYDGEGEGFRLFYDNGPDAFDREDASQGTVFHHVLAARVRTPTREEGCLRIRHRMAGITPDGGEGTGAVDCAVSGIGQDGEGADISGFAFAEGGSGRPADFVFDDNTSHNNNGHGMFIWHNAGQVQPHYDRTALWSNEGSGLRLGAYGNPYVFDELVALDNRAVSVGVKIVPGGEHSPLQSVDLDDFAIESYVLVQQEPNVLVDLRFSGEDPLAFTQVHTPCNTPGEEMDPQSSSCNLVWLRIVDPTFGAGVTQPFDFGWTANFYSRWEVEGFSHPDFPGLPTDFTLHRPDHEVEGGCYYAPFDAWMVPCP